jgi:hypothetical protein
MTNIFTCLFPTQVAGQPDEPEAVEGLTHAEVVERILAAQGRETKTRAEQESGATTFGGIDASATESATTRSLPRAAHPPTGAAGSPRAVENRRAVGQAKRARTKQPLRSKTRPQHKLFDGKFKGLELS